MWQYSFQRQTRALGLIAGLAIASVSSAQTRDGRDSSLQQFTDRAAYGDVAAVRAMSKDRESEHISILKDLFEQARRAADQPLLIQRLRKSLAAIGEPEARHEIARDLNSSNRYSQLDAFLDATEIGGNDMILAVAEKLWDPAPGGRPVGPDGAVVEDEGVSAPRFLAVVALSKLIEDPTAPRKNLNRAQSRDEDVERWRAWWNANKAKYTSSRRRTGTPTIYRLDSWVYLRLRPRFSEPRFRHRHNWDTTGTPTIYPNVQAAKSRISQTNNRDTHNLPSSPCRE